MIRLFHRRAREAAQLREAINSGRLSFDELHVARVRLREAEGRPVTLEMRVVARAAERRLDAVR